MSDEESRPVRLSCRHVWKVFGDGARDFFPAGGEVGDVDGVVANLNDQGLIPAVCDVGFDGASEKSS